MAERVLGGIFSFFAGDEPKVTPQQARDRAQAAGNVEMQHATLLRGSAGWRRELGGVGRQPLS